MREIDISTVHIDDNDSDSGYYYSAPQSDTTNNITNGRIENLYDLSALKQLSSTALGYSGVLFKRRDLFHNEWRPRYFVLSYSTGLLSYYLVGHPSDSQLIYQNSDNLETVHNLMPSEERGTVYIPKCTVRSLDHLSKPGKYYVFSVTPHGTDGTGRRISPWLLSATSEFERSEWIKQFSLCYDILDTCDSGTSSFDWGNAPNIFSDEGGEFYDPFVLPSLLNKKNVVSTHCFPSSLDGICGLIKVCFIKKRAYEFGEVSYFKANDMMYNFETHTHQIR